MQIWRAVTSFLLHPLEGLTIHADLARCHQLPPPPPWGAHGSFRFRRMRVPKIPRGNSRHAGTRAVGRN